jgi:D-alanyl-D-alanine carboxypeptidase (penicillin-binding protein 5/6)
MKRIKHSHLIVSIITWFLVVCFCTGLVLEIPVQAEETDAREEQQDSGTLNITAQSAVLIENSSGRILYQKEKDTERIPASITKIMTLLLIFDALQSETIHLEDMVTVSEYASSMGGSQVFLEAGETQTVDTMIKCISVASANDAAVAMAEYISGSESAFVQKMNEKAESLGMKHTHFMNCNGLDDDIQKGHYSSAYDVSLMSQALITNYPQISQYSTIWMDEITHVTKKGESNFGLTNTNKLIRTYNGITGLKTGSTSKAKYCLSATASRAGVSLTAVVMAAPDPKVRFSEAAALLDYGFANCTGYQEETTKLSFDPVPVAGGVSDTVQPVVQQDFSYTLCKGESKEQIKRQVEYKKNLTAPLKQGDVVGRVVYSLEDQVIQEIPLTAKKDIPKATFSHCFKKLLQKIMVS